MSSFKHRSIPLLCGGNGQVNVPCRVPVYIDREPAALPDDIPLVAFYLFYRVREAQGLDVAGGVGRPEAEQRLAGELVVFEVGGCFDSGTAIVDFALIYRVVPS